LHLRTDPRVPPCAEGALPSPPATARRGGGSGSAGVGGTQRPDPGSAPAAHGQAAAGRIPAALPLRTGAREDPCADGALSAMLGIVGRWEEILAQAGGDVHAAARLLKSHGLHLTLARADP